MAERYELGQLLIMKGVITQEQLEEALALQKKTKKFLGEILVENGYVSREALLECLTEQKKADFIRLSRVKGIKPEVVKLIPEVIARRYTVVAIALSEDVLVVAMKDPTDIVAIDTIKRITDKKVKVVKADEKEILERIDRFYTNTGDLTETIAALGDVKESTEEEIDVNQLKIAAEDAPIVKFVNTIFFQAVEKRRLIYTLNQCRTGCLSGSESMGCYTRCKGPQKLLIPGLLHGSRLWLHLTLVKGDCHRMDASEFLLVQKNLISGFQRFQQFLEKKL